ncbi:MAG: Asp23/Gls24 family envelope stress response protein [Clostridia bacterium]|nr:Asp23/Gls24 family envelope stress response protein [Clostridia bacterium]
MQENKTQLSVSTAVLEKMAQIAALEVEGVTGLSKKAIDIKGTFRTKSAFKGVKAESINGAIEITVYICVDKNAKVREVAEAVQSNVKDKIQTMTGTAVTKVNVSIADIYFEDESEASGE